MLLALAAIVLHTRQMQSAAVLILVVAGLVLRLAFAAWSPELFIWDEQFHALAAKRLIETPLHPRLYPEYLGTDFHDYWTRSYTWLHKPPLAMWLGALSMKAFGATVFAYRLPFVLLGTWTLVLQYRIARQFLNADGAFIAMLLLTLSHYILMTTAGAAGMSGIDTTLLFTTTLGIWAWLRWEERRAWAAAALLGVACGLGLLAKWVVGLLPLAVFALAILLRYVRILSGRRAGTRDWAALPVVGALALLVAAPWYTYAALQYPEVFRTEVLSFMAHFAADAAVIQDQHYPWWIYLLTFPTLYAAVYALLLPFAVGSWLMLGGSARRRWTVLLAIACTYGFFMLADWRIPHYPVILYTLVLVLFAGLFQRLLQWQNRALHASNIRTIAAVAVLILFGGLMFKPRALPAALDAHPRQPALRRLFQQLPPPKAGNRPVVFGAPEAAVPRLMFYSDWLVVRDPCDSPLAVRLVSAGRDCFCLKTAQANPPQLERIAVDGHWQAHFFGKKSASELAYNSVPVLSLQSPRKNDPLVANSKVR